RALQIGGGARLQAHAAQRQPDELEEIGLVVHHEHNGLLDRTTRALRHFVHQLSQRRGSANTSRNTLPPPPRGSYRSVAPFAWASSRARNSPRPVPRPPL